MTLHDYDDFTESFISIDTSYYDDAIDGNCKGIEEVSSGNPGEDKEGKQVSSLAIR